MDQRNLFLAIALSLAILLGFQYFIAPPPEPIPATQTTSETPTPTPSGEAGDVPVVPGAPVTADTAATAAANRDDLLGQAPRVRISSPTLSGSLSLVGGRLDDLTLTKYKETLDPDSPRIILLSPAGGKDPYYADFGWTSGDKGLTLPGAETLWQADREELSPGQPVTLSWDNGAGLRFERVFEIDENYMFTQTQRVVNESGDPVDLATYGLISQTGTPPILGFYILHEGLLGVFDETLKEVDYSDLQEDGVETQSSTGGWLGITAKYWLTALVPDQTKAVETRFVHSISGGQDKYQADYLYPTARVAPGESMETVSRLYAGAKEVLLLDSYEETLGVPRFDLAVDFGWFYFLTKPIFYALHWLGENTGNFGVAILLLTVAIKIIFFPLANKSYRAMAKMRKLQPRMLELRERFGDDKQRLNQEMMQLYKQEGANPLSGCLPIVVQIPVFFALYKVMFVTLEMRQAPFFGWIEDLSAQDPTSFINLFGLLPFAVPHLGPFEIINLGVWPILMGLSMFLQQQLNPQPPDPIQAKIFLFMPIIFTFLLAQFPAGLVIYWTWNNVLSILQQAVIMKRAGVPIGRGASTTGKT